MALGIIWFSAGPQDPIFGINHANIAPELTPKNWRSSAIVRNGLYIWVARGIRGKDGKDIARYCVQVRSGHENSRIEKEFAKRDPALAYANALGSNKGEYPAERSPVTYMTMRPGFGRGPVTTEIPLGKEVKG